MGPFSFTLVHIYVMGSIPTARQGRTTKAPIMLLTRLKKVAMMGLTVRVRGDIRVMMMHWRNFYWPMLWHLMTWCIFYLLENTLVIYIIIKLHKFTSNSKHCWVIALSKCVGGNAYVHALIIDPDWFDVECDILQSAIRWRHTHIINHQFMKSYWNRILTNPRTILPPVCLEWPLFCQLIVGKGWPDAWHSSFTWTPGGTVRTLGHTLTNGGAVRKKK